MIVVNIRLESSPLEPELNISCVSVGGSSLVLAVIDSIEEFHPSIDGEGETIELGAIGEAAWSTTYSFLGSILPHVAEIKISLSIFQSGLDIARFETQFSGDLFRPICDEISLGSGLHAENGLELAVAEVAIFILEAGIGVVDADIF